MVHLYHLRETYIKNESCDIYNVRKGEEIEC